MLNDYLQRPAMSVSGATAMPVSHAAAPVFSQRRSLASRRHQLPHIHLSGLQGHGVVDYPVHDGVCVGSPAEPAMPILHPVLGAPYRRRFVVATVDELQEEPHLVGVERIHEPLVHDENLVARVLLQHLRFGDAGGQVLLARHQQVGHAHVEGAQAVLAGLPPDRAGEEGLAGSGVADHDDVGCRFHELAGPEAVDGVAGKRPAVVDDAVLALP